MQHQARFCNEAESVLVFSDQSAEWKGDKIIEQDALFASCFQPSVIIHDTYSPVTVWTDSLHHQWFICRVLMDDQICNKSKLQQWNHNMEKQIKIIN